LLFTIRASSAISFSEPLQVQTTGDEFSNFFFIWKEIQGLTVYTSRFESPYVGNVYNWLFYTSYGAVISAVLSLFSLSDSWLPTVGRFMSFIAMVVGAVVAYTIYARVISAHDFTKKLLCLVVAVFVTFGPLMGFWVITVRADLWAMTFEICGIAFFLACYPTRRITAVILLALFVYIAWSFKQGSIYSAGGAAVLLLARRDWKPLIVLAVSLPVAWAITFLVGSDVWSDTILFKGYLLFYSVEHSVRVITNFAVKIGPILFFLLGLTVVAVKSRERRLSLWRSDAFILAAGASICAVFLSIPASVQTGSAENYFFTLSFFLSLMLMASLPILMQEGGVALKIPLWAGSAGWGSLCVAIGLVFFGIVGITDVSPQHERNMYMKNCTDTLPRPLFINHRYMGLPWMTPNNAHYVLSYIYEAERATGQAFEHGGIGGLIRKGHFASIVTPSPISPSAKIDGATLENYTPVDNPECTGMSVFHKKQQN